MPIIRTATTRRAVQRVVATPRNSSSRQKPPPLGQAFCDSGLLRQHHHHHHNQQQQQQQQQYRNIMYNRMIRPCGTLFINKITNSNSWSSLNTYAPPTMPQQSHHGVRLYHTTTTPQASSPFDPENPSTTATTNTQTNDKTSNKKIKGKKQRAFVPRKAAVQLTEKARTFFKALLENPPRPDIIGIQLNYQQSKSTPRMVFAFTFVTAQDLGPTDEGVSLEVVKNEKGVTVPKAPADAQNDGLPKLYVSGDAFLKVLGAKVDVDTESVAPILYDKEGNLMDPNA